jgi:5,10-methylenetetrahydromethanopterin reductase
MEITLDESRKSPMTLRFGLRVPTVGSPQDTAIYAREVEAAGFDFMWMPDTPLLAGRWRDVYMHLGAAALATSKIRLGPGVTNPLTRHPLTTASTIATLDDASEGRADLVVGTGYSSAYIIGRKAATLADMSDSVALWRSLYSGAPTELGGLQVTLDPPYPGLPIIIAATGPKMLALAGRIADGVLIHVGAAPGAVAWALEHLEAGIAEAVRAPGDVQRIVVLTACIDEDRDRAIEQMRPCAAGLCRNGHADVLFGRAGLQAPIIPEDYQEPYPDLGHAVDWEAAKRAASYVPDAAVEACIALGSGAEVAERVRALGALDIDAIWWRDEATWTRPDALMHGLVSDVLPRLRNQ